MEEMDRRDSGFGSISAKITMTLANRSGARSVRRLTLNILEATDAGVGNKSLVTFSSPPDVNGTKFLSHTHLEQPDEQWLYLPALKRVKRLSSGDVSGSFMGSEFAYEDLSSQEIEDYTHKYTHDDTANGAVCFVVERRPVNLESGYSKSVVWLDTSQYRVQRIDYYDRNGGLLKRLIVSDYHQYQNRFWRAHQMEMTNLKTGKSAKLEWTNIIFGSELKESDFSLRTLKRDSR
jgi:outer membrane lipoprotein-sorting protein